MNVKCALKCITLYSYVQKESNNPTKWHWVVCSMETCFALLCVASAVERENYTAHNWKFEETFTLAALRRV